MVNHTGGGVKLRLGQFGHKNDLNRIGSTKLVVMGIFC